jgi:hypothetical protein
MGREIRRVPADWEHPKSKHREGYQPLYDRDFESAARKWLDNAIAWDNGTDPDCVKYKRKYPFYWQWSNPPNKDYYRPKWKSDPTHYQVYETVSEGTPVTPHFATKEELIDYLVVYGDEWDQKRYSEGRQPCAGWLRKNAEEFVGEEWAPSMILIDGVMKMPRDGSI